MHEKKEYRYTITVRIRQQMHFDVASYCNVLKTDEMRSSYNQFLFYMFVYVWNESSRSSSGKGKGSPHNRLLRLLG